MLLVEALVVGLTLAGKASFPRINAKHSRAHQIKLADQVLEWDGAEKWSAQFKEVTKYM